MTLLREETNVTRPSWSGIEDKVQALLDVKGDAALDEATLKVDRSLSRLLPKLSFLEQINPTNLESEKQLFFQSHYRKNPAFCYRPINIDIPYLKRKLYSLPTRDIPDPLLQKLYQDVVEAQAEELDLLNLRGERRFLYTSLKHHGEPEAADIANARFLLHCQDVPPSSEESELLDAEGAASEIKRVVAGYGFDYQVEFSKKIPSRALFSSAKRTLKIRSGELFTKRAARALGHHEIGVHMLTTMNASVQCLKVLKVGMPMDTLTQEGLAILSEYLSGNLDLNRLKMLARRVLAVHHMVKHYDFKETFHYLMDACGLNQEEAYYLTVRVYRGGGFTKDFVYLKGFRMLLSHYRQGRSWIPLLLGKTSIDYLSTLEELLNRGVLKAPSHLTHCFLHPTPADPAITYVVNCLQ